MSAYVSHMHPYAFLLFHDPSYASICDTYEEYEYSYGSISTHPSILSLRRGTQGVMRGVEERDADSYAILVRPWGYNPSFIITSEHY